MMSATQTPPVLNGPRGTVSRTLPVAAIILAGILSIVFLSRWIDAHRPPTPSSRDEEGLYLSGNSVRRLSLAFNGLAADWYWMRSLQYVGKKIINAPEDVVLDDLSKLDLQTLAPLLDTATTLDPTFLEPYEYAALVLPGVDVREAIRITNKGIANNPDAWRLYQHLGYIYWRQRDYKAASEAYATGARTPGAPGWMEAMSAHMASEGGSRAVAREIYSRMYEQANDDKVKDMAHRRLLQLDSLDAQVVLKKVLAAYQTRLGRCPNSWREVEPALRSQKWMIDSAGAPLDPGGTPYVLKQGCEIALNPDSTVLRF